MNLRPRSDAGTAKYEQGSSPVGRSSVPRGNGWRLTVLLKGTSAEAVDGWRFAFSHSLCAFLPSTAVTADEKKGQVPEKTAFSRLPSSGTSAAAPVPRR
ncbi:unnamed protein product [Merluccius merluccius]